MKFSKLFIILAAAVMLAAFGAGVALAGDGKVFQGTCVFFDEAKGVMAKCNFCMDLIDQGQNPACVDACPVDCIHPKQDEPGFAETPQLYVNPNDCIDCGACVPVCPSNSMFPLEELPAEQAQFAELNAAHYN